MTRRDFVDLLLLAAIWGASFLFMRVAAPEFGAIPLIWIRVLVAALFLSAVLSKRGGFGEMRGRVGTLSLVGAINSALPFSLFAFATLSLPAGFSAVLNATAPLFGAIVAYVWLKESLAPSRVLGLATGFAGVLVLVSGRISLRADLAAIVAGLAGALLYGIAAHYTKKNLAGAPPLVIATGSQIAASGLLLLPALYYWPTIVPSATAWFFAIVLGVACTGVAYVLYFRLIARAGAARAIAVTYLIPVFGMCWGYLFLGERVTPSMVLGCAVILLGIALTTGVLALSRSAKETPATGPKTAGPGPHTSRPDAVGRTV
jgi:drug/metabolite transporter (DMT)-like permease